MQRHATRSRGSFLRFLATLLVLTPLLMLPARKALAQTGTISGLVLDHSGAPLQNAQVTVRGTQFGSQTDAEGRFRISGVSGSSAVLDIRRLGYKMATATATVGSETRISMEPASINLDAVVVTGQPGSTNKRTLGVDIAQIDASAITAKAPINNVQNLLNGRATGVTILQNSGVIGAGATVRIRGVSSFALSNQPLIYVDGVRIDNSQSTGPDNITNQDFGANTTTRWNDMNPDDIESIEIVKGPAAATLYGTEAANGVIQIITKKGAQGKPTWDLTTRQGVSQFADQASRLWTNYGIDPVTKQVTSLNIAQRESDAGHPIFKNGHSDSYDLGYGGGTPQVRYRVSGNFKRDGGVTPDNKQKMYGGRANLVMFPNDRFEIQTNLGYVSGDTRLACEAGCGGTTWTSYFATPENLHDANGVALPNNGFLSGLPSAYYQQYFFTQVINRFTGSVQITHNPVGWFSQHVTLGTDQGVEDSEALSPKQTDPQLIYFFGADADSGFKDVASRNNSLSTLTYGGTIKAGVRELSTSTSFGADFIRRHTKYISGFGKVFPAPGLTSLSSTTQNRTGSETVVQNNTVGVYAQEQLGFRDRLFLTAGLRSDNNSSFGTNFKRVYYPKFSASWVVSEEPFYRVPFVNTLKLRSAYGQTGQAPLPYSAVPFFTAVTGPGGSAAVTPASRGNPDLGPERGYETEFGFDAGFLNDRAGIEYTHFSGGTRNAIVEKPVAPSSGYPGTQLVNAGKLTKHGDEVMLRATAFTNERTTWDMTFSVGTNHTKVVDLGGAAFISPGSLIRHAVGYPVGAWWAKRVVDVTIDPTTGDATAVFCDPGAAGGAAVLCANAPAVFYGSSTPTSEGSFTSTLSFFSNFNVYTMVDFKRGFKKLDANRRVRCHLFAECRENYFPKEFSPIIVGAVTSSTLYNDVLNDASFTKLREISLSYTLPGQFATRVGASRATISVSGRNLHTWTGYKGLDPEGGFQGGQRGFGQWEQDVTPQLRTYLATLRLVF
ncbi:MAG: SusC/RagA family TonB-linked outer membrane protein [Gemmatimonadota bacterium]|nr:SusC/RagA family TonB-linked outer membrane protein [Gemmatimonadota bacterium]